MRRSGVLVLVMAVLLAAGVAQAGQGQGAVVFRAETTWWWFVWSGENLAVYSSEQNFGFGVCPFSGDNWMISDIKGVLTPSGKQNFWIKGDVFTRVYPGINPDTYPGWYWDPAFLCGFLEATPYVAEGIAKVHWTDANTCAWGPGQNTWYQRFEGTLYTSSATCPSGMARHQTLLKQMLANGAVIDPVTCAVDPADVRLILFHGPSLKCIGK